MHGFSADFFVVTMFLGNPIVVVFGYVKKDSLTTVSYCCSSVNTHPPDHPSPFSSLILHSSFINILVLDSTHLSSDLLFIYLHEEK